MGDSSLLINIGTAVGVVAGIGGIYGWLHTIKKDLNESLDKKDAEVENLEREIVDIKLNAARSENKCTEADSVLRHEIGETGHALRSKIHEFELWTRDKYVSKETFEIVVSRIESSFREGFTRLEKTFDDTMSRLEKRMDDDKATALRDRDSHSSGGPRPRRSD